MESIPSLKFRRLSERDLEQLRKWRMAPDVTRYLLTDPVITADSQMRWWESVKDDVRFKCWIVEADGTDIGYCDLQQIDTVKKQADPGVYICREDYRGRGLAKHIMRNQHRYAFEELGLNRLYAPVLAANEPMVAAFLATGFVVEEHQKERIQKYGKSWDMLLVSLEVERWRKVGRDEQYIKGSFDD